MSEAVTLAGFAVIGVAALGLQLAAALGRRTATLAEAIGALMARRVPRLLLRVAWLWLGWHLFARVGPE